MADNQEQNMPAVPAGFTENVPAPPSGFTEDVSAGAVPTAPPGFTEDVSQPQDNRSYWQRAREAVTGVAKGAEAGAVETGMGIGELGHRAIHAALPERAAEVLSPRAGMEAERTLAKPALDVAAEAKAHPFTAAGIGYAGETLTEFLLGDAALKNLSAAEKLTQAGKIARVLQSSPRLTTAVKLGAEAMRMGGVQAAQTYARTGDVGEAAKTGAEMGATAGVLGVAGKAIGATGERLAATRGTLEKLASEGGNAVEPEVLTETTKKTIQQAERDMHDAYEAGYQQLKGLIGDTTIEASKNPLSTVAGTVLKTEESAVAAEHPLVSQAKGLVGKGLDPDVRDMVYNLAKGLKNAGVDDEGQVIKIPSGDYGIDDLIKLRQTLRSVADGFDYGDVNARTLRKLLKPINETIGALAQKSGNSGAQSIFENMNASYGKMAQVFENSNFINKLSEGKYDDVAKEFLKGGQVRDKLADLSTVLNPTELNEFGRQIFGQMEKNAAGDPAVLINQYGVMSKKLGESGMNALFGGYRSAGEQLVKEAGQARTMQRAVQGAVLYGGFASHIAAVQYALGLMGIAEATGGRLGGLNVLHALANNPTLWKGLGTAGAVAAKAAPVATAVAARAVQPAIQMGAAPASRAAAETRERAMRVLGGARGPMTEPEGGEFAPGISPLTKAQ